MWKRFPTTIALSLCIGLSMLFFVAMAVFDLVTVGWPGRPAPDWITTLGNITLLALVPWGIAFFIESDSDQVRKRRSRKSG